MARIPVAKLFMWLPNSGKFLAVKDQGQWNLPETLSVGQSVVRTLTEYAEKILGYVIPEQWISLDDEWVYRYDNATVLKVDCPKQEIPDGDDRRWFTIKEWQQSGSIHVREVLSTIRHFDIIGPHVVTPLVRTQLCGLFLGTLPANETTLALYREYTDIVVAESRMNLRLYRGVLSTWKSALIQTPRKEGVEYIWEIDSWRLRVSENKWSVEFHHALTPAQAVHEYRSCLGYLNLALDSLGLPSMSESC